MAKKQPDKLAVLGHPIAGSVLPQIFATLGKLLDRDVACRAVDADAAKLPAALAKLVKDGFAGALLSMPLKRAGLTAGTASAEARAIGAANCLKLEAGGAVKAHNTEAAGFYDAVSEAGFKARDGRAQILGSGCAARAAAYALGRAGARQVQIWDRKMEAAETLAMEMGRYWPDTIFSAGPCGPAELWFQATPMGLPGFPEKLPVKKLLPGAVVAVDLVCGKPTQFLALAAASRARALDGKGVLVYQAMRAWELWFGAVGGPGRAVLKADVMRVRKWR